MASCRPAEQKLRSTILIVTGLFVTLVLTILISSMLTSPSFASEFPAACNETKTLPVYKIQGKYEETAWLAEKLHYATDGILWLCQDDHQDINPGSNSIIVSEVAIADTVREIKPRWDQEIDRLQRLYDRVPTDQICPKNDLLSALSLRKANVATWQYLGSYLNDLITRWETAKTTRQTFGWSLHKGVVRLVGKDDKTTRSLPLEIPKTLFGLCLACNCAPHAECAHGRNHDQVLDIVDLEYLFDNLSDAFENRWKNAGYSKADPVLIELHDAVRDFILVRTFLHIYLHETEELFQALSINYTYPSGGFMRSHWVAEQYSSLVTDLRVFREHKKDTFYRRFYRNGRRGRKIPKPVRYLIPLRIDFNSPAAQWSVKIVTQDFELIQKPEIDFELDFYLKQENKLKL